MIVNLIFVDAIENDAAHQAYRDTMQSVAAMLGAHITDNITVNINVDLDNFNGAALPANVSEGNIQTFPTISYSDFRNDLATKQVSLSADDTTALNALPTGSSIGGQSSFIIGTAQQKALGLISATDAAVDGTIGMNSSFGTGDVLFAGALHEITHAMGRIAGTTLDIYRFNEDGTNNHVFGSAVPAPADAYFSIDGGTTELADFGKTSDPGDFLNGGVQGTDPFNETVGGRGLTAVDLEIMDVLGFTVTNAAPTVAALMGSVGEDGPSFSKDLLTGAADPEGDSISIKTLVGSVTTSGGRSLTLGTDYTFAGSTISLTAAGFAKFNSLAAGSTDTATFGFKVEDFLLADTSNALTLTINGQNDGPILAADVGSPHQLTELAGTVNSASLDQVSGTLAFTDPDIGDTHSAGASLNSLIWSAGGSAPSAVQTAFASAMSASIDFNGTTGTLGWHFSLADMNVDFLAENETLKAIYNVTVSDNHFASSTKQVEVDFTGTNDTPVVDVSSILANSTSERPNLTNSPLIDSTPLGFVAFSDPDLSDRPTATLNTLGETVTWQDATHDYTSELTPAQIAILKAALTIGAEAGNTNVGKIDWHYDIVDKNLDFLGGGESLTVTAPIVIDDGRGGVISQNVVATVNGANDNPIAAADSNGTAKKSVLTVSASTGLLSNDTDPDTHDNGHLFVGAVGGSAANVGHSVAGTYGSVIINADGSYVYTADKGGLPSKIVAQDTFAYTVADGHGGTDTSTLSIIVTNPNVDYLAGANTTLKGGNGQQVLDGSAGHDVLIGGNSPDVLVGGVMDTLTGGNGPDTFLFRPHFGANAITDFDFHNDAIQLDKSIFSSVADLLSHTTDTVNGAVINDTHGDTITLTHVTLLQLQTHSNDFYLV